MVHLNRTLGVLMLQTRFERVVGDIGNPATFDFPVRYHVVQGATVDRVVTNTDVQLLEPFLDGALRLERQGVDAVATSCGFLIVFQSHIQQMLTVPFVSSALLLVQPLIERTGARVGVITASAAHLSAAHVEAAGCPDVVVAGMDDSPAFQQAIIDQTAPLDQKAIAAETQAVARGLVARHGVDAIVLECTNLAPYRETLQTHLDIPVRDITTLCEDVIAQGRP